MISIRPAVILVTLCLAGCHARGPAPQVVIDQIRASAVADHQPGATFTVESITYTSTLPPSREAAGDIPAGTVMYYYAVRGTLTPPGSSPKSMTRLFYVYTDSSGNWRFIENKTGSNYDSEPSMPAAQ